MLVAVAMIGSDQCIVVLWYALSTAVFVFAITAIESTNIVSWEARRWSGGGQVVTSSSKNSYYLIDFCAYAATGAST